MIVVDTSAVIEVLVGDTPDRDLVERIGAADQLHAPHLIDYEFVAVLRRLVLRREISADRASDARLDFEALSVERYPLTPDMADRLWQLRDNVGSYDAAYIALAETLGLPLATTDARLGSAPGHRAEVEVFAAGQRG